MRDWWREWEWRNLWVYPFIFLLYVISGEWRAKIYQRKHPERGI